MLPARSRRGRRRPKLVFTLIYIMELKKNSAYDIIADYSPLLPLPRTTLRLLTTMESQI